MRVAVVMGVVMPWSWPALIAVVVVVFVPVVPEFGLVEQEEKHQPDQQRA